MINVILFPYIWGKFYSFMSKCEQCIIKQANELKHLTQPELQLLTRNKGHIIVNKGEHLMMEGAPINGVYCVRSGKCKVTKLGVNGKEHIIKFIKKGDLIGHRSILSNELVSLSVIALEETHVCFLPKHAVLKIFKSNYVFSQQLIQNISQQLNQANCHISHMAQKSVKGRLADLILKLDELFGTLQDGFIDIKLTREEIANTIGTATESAIRLLSELRKKDIIELEAKRIKILNKKALIDIANKS